jgi:hypothetical protein
MPVLVSLADASSNGARSGAHHAESSTAHSGIRLPENNKAHSQVRLAEGSVAQSTPSFSERLASLNESQGLSLPFPFTEETF